MPRMKDDELRFRHALASSGKRIEDIDPLEIAKRAKVHPRRAEHFARVLRGPSLPPLPAKPAKKPEGKAQNADVQG